jgi:CDP-paratose 2-epimerase
MKKLLITGGAGFIGCNAVTSFTQSGWDVAVVDNLSREGARQNLDWLRDNERFIFHEADVRDPNKLDDIVKLEKPDAVLHLAGQVAVTTSVENPREDFEVNALGTFNLLEAVRRFAPEAAVIYSSTNKVYGHLDNVRAVENNRRYELPDLPNGISEMQPLDFHSPYGCSKGSADQYMIDYHRIYGLRTVTMRQSCIYGYRQFGIEDQGWVAWFTIALAMGKPVTIYGNGKQVRDVLFIDDLIQAYSLAIERADKVAGAAFNIGGGSHNTLSLLEFVDILQELAGKTMPVSYDDWRPGDQPIYISDITKAETSLGWTPKIKVREGLQRLHDWVESNREMFVRIYQGG